MFFKRKTIKQIAKEVSEHVRKRPYILKHGMRDIGIFWILARNRWVDDGIWIDTETWND